MGNEAEKSREERGYDSFTVAQDGTLSGCMDDSGMTRFAGQVSPDGSYHARLIRLEGTLQGTISPEGGVTGTASTRGREIPCRGLRILNEAKPGGSPFAGEYRVTQPALRPPVRQEAEKAAHSCPDAGQERSFLSTVRDQKALAWLGRYYADKITTAVHLRLSLVGGDETYRKEAVADLQRALEHWKNYAAVAGAQYRPQLLCRHGMLDLAALTEQVEKDIETAKWLTKDLI